jgi:hypothetical protein
VGVGAADRSCSPPRFSWSLAIVFLLLAFTALAPSHRRQAAAPISHTTCLLN